VTEAAPTTLSPQGADRERWPTEALDAFRRMDSLSATLSELAQTSGRLSPGAISSTTHLTQYDTDNFYRANGYAANIVDMLANDATRKGFDVTVSETEDDDEGEADSHPFDEDLKRLGLNQALNHADKLARKDGSSAIYVVTEGGGDPSQALNLGTLRRVLSLTIIEGWYFTPRTWQTNFHLPGFGLPLTYDIQPQVAGGGSTSMETVHASRLLVFDGRWMPARIRDANPRHMADSVLQVSWRRIQDLSRADQDIGIIMRSMSQGVLKIAGLAQLFASGNCEAVSQRLALTNAGLSSLGLTVLDAENNEDLSYATRTVAGLSDLYDRTVQSVAAVARMPVTKLAGTSPGGLSTDDASGSRSWDDQVGSHQTDDLQPHVERVVDLLSASSAGPTNGQEIESTVSWRPLRQMTEAELADIRAKQAATDKTEWEMGVLTDAEIRESRHGGATWSAQTTLQSDEDLTGMDPAEAQVSS